MQEPDIFKLTLDLLEKTYLATSYPDKEDADSTFRECKEHLNSVTLDSASGLWNKFCTLGVTVFSCSALNDMVKIVWRMVKDKGGGARDMLCLFVMGIAAILHTQEARQGKAVVKEWEKTCVTWLGIQLTIGGKGVTGEGEGSTLDRIQRFFNTPYLHDFD